MSLRRAVLFGLMVVALVAMALPVWGQNPACQPTPETYQWLTENGWEPHGSLFTEGGVAIVLYCNGDAGLLIGHPPSEAFNSCLLSVLADACVVVLPSLDHKF